MPQRLNAAGLMVRVKIGLAAGIRAVRPYYAMKPTAVPPVGSSVDKAQRRLNMAVGCTSESLTEQTDKCMTSYSL